ncbi:L-xylulose reductase [Colletotrichum orbiculare MAFF 240422]|uniref:L-xylulose reductase n=1 Tax=Colletotrichum orbiculare (strain 104-T / ATCC 96160 / CBS 514.97 / LARS 414 / MAFF 240422) TaxID=1213857 RepID=A0A484FRH4_COLOR|nr:L-xylulose reductase [Colletotrichum orbiculare MAFF 240422]
MTATQIPIAITQAPPYRVHEGKTAVITDGARSIGASIAQNLASKGADVVLVYLNQTSDEPAASLAAELSKAHNVKALPVRADFSTPEGCSKIVDAVEGDMPPNAQSGRPQVDILVNCAAVFHAAPLEAVGVADFHKIYSPLLPEDAKKAISIWYPLTPLSGIREWDSDEQKETADKYGGRAGCAEEIAGIVGMICSPESGWMTGCLASANGGQWMAS